MDSMVTCLLAGLTRTRIIDCVSTWSALNLESSSEPSNRTVNAVPKGVGLGVGIRLGEGDGTLTTCPVASNAVFAAGKKYARAPAKLDMITATTAIARIRKGFGRRREARARRPG